MQWADNAPSITTMLAERMTRGQMAALALLTAILALAILAPESAETAGPLGVMLGYGAAGMIITKKTQGMTGRDRRAWRLVGTGFLAAATGVALLAAFQLATGSVSAFGPLDTFFVTAYALVLTGLVSLPHLPAQRSERARLLLDSLIGMVSLGAIMWVVVLDDLLHDLVVASAWDRWAGTAYPILDVGALMVLIIVSVRRGSFRFDPRLFFLALGIMLQSAADLTFLATGVGKSFAEAQPNFPIFILATIFFVVAAVIVDRQPAPREFADRRTPILAVVTPYSVALALVVLLAVRTRDMGLPAATGLLLTATYVVGILVIVRQGLAIRENRIAVERQRNSLVSSISHELRTPLTAVVGFLEVLKQKSAYMEPDERDELVTVASQQARHMSRIVADLILLARGGPDEMALRERKLSLDAVVAGAIRSVDHLDVELETEIEDELSATLDPDRIQQILVNLLSNAARYGRGKGLVVVTSRDSDVCIEVHDNGPGVPKKHELKIWERFDRGPHHLNGAIPGSGIGLAVVSAIAKAHGGSAFYRPSERLGGACFEVLLPNRRAAA